MTQEDGIKEIDERVFLQPDVLLEHPCKDPPNLSPRGRKLIMRVSTILSMRQWFLLIRGRSRHILTALVTQEQERGTGFLLLPVFAGIGSVIYFILPHEPQWLALFSSLGVLTFARFLARTRVSIAFFLTCALAALVGVFAAKLETMRTATPMLGGDITTRIVGRIVAMDENSDGGWRVTLDLLSTERPKLRYAPDHIRLSVRDLPADADVGSGLTGLARLRAQSGPIRPGNYDFAFHAYFNGIGANGFFLGTPMSIVVPPPESLGSTIGLLVERVRQRLTERLVSGLAGEEGAIAAALITGKRRGISEETNEAIRQSGLAHILSISGLHMGLASGLVMVVLRAIFALFPGFVMRYPVKKYAAISALAAAAFYLALSGANIAAQRSFVMLAVMLSAIIMDREAITMRNLAIALLVVMIWVPHEILGPSFQMSFSATAALIAAFSWWTQSRRINHDTRYPHRSLFPSIGVRIFRKLITSGGAIAATSIVAGVASGIFAAYHFNNTAPLGLLGNVAALPIISLIVMPFAVMSLIAIPFDLEWFPLQVMGEGIFLVKWIAFKVASISPNGNPGIVPVSTLILWSCGLILAVFLTTHLRVICLAFIASGLFFYLQEQRPDIIVSEDGRLVAFLTEDGALAVNRRQPSRFIIENWQKAYSASHIIVPITHSTATSEQNGFECEEGLCLAEMRNGDMLAFTDNLANQTTACALGRIVILAFPGKNISCSQENTITITLRDLAVRGALEIRLRSGQRRREYQSTAASDALPVNHNIPDTLIAKPILPSVPPEMTPPEMTYAIGPPERPWNHYRLYSRIARGLTEKPRSDRIFKQ